MPEPEPEPTLYLVTYPITQDLGEKFSYSMPLNARVLGVSTLPGAFGPGSETHFIMALVNPEEKVFKTIDFIQLGYLDGLEESSTKKFLGVAGGRAIFKSLVRVLATTQSL